MNETVVMVICAVAGSFFGQLAANLLFPAVTRDDRESQFAWMRCQEDINRLLRERVTRLEALARQASVVTGESMLKSHLSSGAIQPLDLRNNGDKK
jgi:hypothetical protein